MPKGKPATGHQMTSHRRQILEILQELGPIEDPSGRAVAQLQALTGHKTAQSLSQNLKAMEDKGLITRDIEGRRTFRIALPEQIVVSEGSGTVSYEEVLDSSSLHDDTAGVKEMLAASDGLDYEMLAGVMLKMAVRGLEAPPASQQDLLNRKLLQAETRVHELQQELQAAKADASSALAQLEQLQKNYNVLMAKLDKVPARASGNTIRSILGDSERKALDKLMRELPTSRG